MPFTTPDGMTFETRKEWKKHYLTLVQVKNVEGQEIIRRSPIVGGQAFDIEHVKNCQILVLDHTEQVQIDFAEGCRIFIGACCSSVFIRNCRDCEFTVACKQLRTRDCNDIRVNLFCSSEPVVETTTNAKIFPFNGSYAGIKDHFLAANLDPGHNTWYKVFDFSKDASEAEVPQPHFSVVRKRNPEWRVEGGEGVNANPVPLASDTATDAEDGGEGDGATKGVFSFDQTQEEVEAILAQQQQEDQAEAAASALPAPSGGDGAPLPTPEGGANATNEATPIPPVGTVTDERVTEIAQAANAAGFATDETNIRFILTFLSENLG